MGLLSKLTGSQDVENAAKKFFDGFGDIAQQFGNDIKNASGTSDNSSARPQSVSNTASESAPTGPSGFSWGPSMPAEENQFNYSGSATAYFENIFNTDFSAYKIEKDSSKPNRTIYTFFNGGQKALVTEVMTSQCTAKKLRYDCEAAGIPYLRYYTDHEGWWNTREYVVTRTKKALGI